VARIEVIPVPQDHHGEGPVWLESEQALAWVDVYEEPSIQRFFPATGAYESLAMPVVTSCLAPTTSGSLLAGMIGGFHFVDSMGKTTLIADPSLPNGQELLCDGKCDPAGRFWCASLSRDFRTPIGRLWRLAPDGTCTEMDSGYLTGNGVAFSPDADRLYVADSRAETVWVYDFDVETGTIRNKRVFLSTGDMLGRADGATVDSDGNYWCAMVEGWAVIAVNPDGKVVERIELPVEFPTMCTFGGPNLDVLYVTTSRMRLDEDGRKSQPLSGSLLAIKDLGAYGLPVWSFGA
jgi:sugar lactone lactonase YvrE